MMGQQEVIEHLRLRRQTGDHGYYNIREIAKELDCSYVVAQRAIYKLARSGFLESKVAGDLFDWYRSFRLPEKYVDMDNCSPFNDS